MTESQEYGSVARYFIDSPPGTGKRATKYDKGPFFTFYKGDYRGAWTSYYDDAAKIKDHNERKGIKPSFCKAYTWTEVKFVVEKMITFKDIIWRHGNNQLQTTLIEVFGSWENVHIGKELREEINRYPNPLPLAPNELAPPSSQASSHSSGLSLSQPPLVRTPVSSQGFSPTRSPSTQTTPNRPSNKRQLFASPSSSQGSTQPMDTVTGRRSQVVGEDVCTATSVLWTPRSLSMGATYQLELIDNLVDELMSLRPHFESQITQVMRAASSSQGSPTPKTPQNQQAIGGDCEEVSDTEYGDDDGRETRYGRAGPSVRRSTRPRRY